MLQHLAFTNLTVLEKILFTLRMTTDVLTTTTTALLTQLHRGKIQHRCPHFHAFPEFHIKILQGPIAILMCCFCTSVDCLLSLPITRVACAEYCTLGMSHYFLALLDSEQGAKMSKRCSFLKLLSNYFKLLIVPFNGHDKRTFRKF